MRRLAERKEAEFSRLMGDQQPLVASGVREFMENLAAQQVLLFKHAILGILSETVFMFVLLVESC